MRKLPIIIIVLIFISGCQKENKISKDYFLFGTSINITIYLQDKKKGEKILEEAFDEMERIDKMYNSHNNESEIKKINKGSGDFVKVSSEIIELLRNAKKMSEITQGRYDITISPLLKLWGFDKSITTLPSNQDIQGELVKVDYSKIQITGTSVKIDRGQEIDTGSFLKGYAIYKAREILVKNGVKSGIISAVSSIATINQKPNGEKWKIGLQNPINLQKIIGILEIKDMSIGVSGDYQNYVEIEGEKYHHIFDATTGYPVKNIRMLVVLAEDTYKADLYSTALFTLGAKGAIDYIEKLAGIEAIAVDKDMKIHMTKGAKYYFKEVDRYE